jgi:hypothetical protein
MPPYLECYVKSALVLVGSAQRTRPVEDDPKLGGFPIMNLPTAMGCIKPDAAEQAAWRSTAERPPCPQRHTGTGGCSVTNDDASCVPAARLQPCGFLG